MCMHTNTIHNIRKIATKIQPSNAMFHRRLDKLVNVSVLRERILSALSWVRSFSRGVAVEHKVNTGVHAAVQNGQQHQGRDDGCWDDKRAERHAIPCVKAHT